MSESPQRPSLRRDLPPWPRSGIDLITLPRRDKPRKQHHRDPSALMSSTQTGCSAHCWLAELKIIQQQAGHEHASTTALYTCVSSDFRTRTLRRVLDATASAAIRPGRSA